MSSVAVELLSEMQPALEAALPIFKKKKQISDELLKTMEETEKKQISCWKVYLND